MVSEKGSWDLPSMNRSTLNVRACDERGQVDHEEDSFNLNWDY